MTTGMYRSREEQDPGKLMYRHKGVFASEIRARTAQKSFVAAGIKAQVRKYTDGYSLYVMSKHDFWKGSFIVDKVK
jgi:hypothetical protein